MHDSQRGRQGRRGTGHGGLYWIHRNTSMVLLSVWASTRTHVISCTGRGGGVVYRWKIDYSSRWCLELYCTIRAQASVTHDVPNTTYLSIDRSRAHNLCWTLRSVRRRMGGYVFHRHSHFAHRGVIGTTAPLVSHKNKVLYRTKR